MQDFPITTTTTIVKKQVNKLFVKIDQKLFGGAGWPILELIQWREPKFNLGELARLRFIRGYDQQKLAGLTSTEQEIVRCRLLSKK